MTFRTKLLVLNCLPLVVFVAISLVLGLTQFKSSLYHEKEGNLRSTAMAAMTLYSAQGYGDYRRRDDGDVWRGMNFNVSEKTSLADDLKDQTDVDITFFFGDTAAMTSIKDAKGVRRIGLTADSAVIEYTINQGNQVWLPEIRVNGEMCQAYAIPIRQESDNSVVGALMASQSAKGFNDIISTYIVTTVFTMLVMFVAVFFFIRWHVGWFAQKYSEISDKSRHDLLTGLCNKLTFESDVKKYLQEKKPGDMGTLLIFDFDNFKHINDNYGHQTGDEVLKAFGSTLIRAFRTQDIIGRIGGDEFMVYMPGMTKDTVKRADDISTEILQTLHDMKVGEAEHFSCSIGIGTDMTDYDFARLYKLADSALYESKKRGKACYVRYSSADHPIEPEEETPAAK